MYKVAITETVSSINKIKLYMPAKFRSQIFTLVLPKCKLQISINDIVVKTGRVVA